MFLSLWSGFAKSDVLLTWFLFFFAFWNQHMNEQNILNAVCIEKDVDGFHPLNIGRLAMRGREPLFVPCTPKGCIELLHRYKVDIKGKNAVVIGRSNIVGMPAALLLQVVTLMYLVTHSFISYRNLCCYVSFLSLILPRPCFFGREKMLQLVLCTPKPRIPRRSLNKQTL